ncbi:MAG TPA: pitrilysin family protein [Candidatus Acidoferrum sp.]|jgi:predicted Zn-dependent peptidase|nr:pitrilysin family protein [Candidatus Acidoferrum sp.]
MKLANSLRLLVLATSAITASAGIHAQSLHLPPHEKVVLKNGLTLLLLEKHGVPIVSFSAIVKTGSAADPAGQEGVASVTAELLRKGTKNRTAQQFAADLDFIGGSFNAGASADFTSISAEFLTKDLARGLDLFADAVLHPAFPQNEVEKLLAQDIDGVKEAKDQAQEVLGIYYNTYLLPGHPYGRPQDGDEISLKSIQRDAVAKFYETYYAPGNTILAVAGEFNGAEMRKKLEGALGAWPAQKYPVVSIPVAAVVKGKRVLLVDKPDATQTYFAIGNLGTAVNDPDRVAIRVVNTILGGRFTSMLNEALRVESGLSYAAGSGFDSRKTPGPFGIFSFTKNESTAQALDLALQVLQKLHKGGVTPEQLASAKSYIKGQFPPTIETSGQLARRIATDEFYGFDDSEVNQLEAKIDAVTPEMARQVIKKHFPLDNLVFVLIGKASAIAPTVQKYAEKQDARPISEPGFWPPPAAAKSAAN